MAVNRQKAVAKREPMAAQMSFEDFENSLAHDLRPPTKLRAPLQALWLEAKGDWEGAHLLAQTAEAAGGDGQIAREGNWVHAYLHRKECDESNAAYWYARAGRPVAKGDLAAEWKEIARALLEA